MNKIRMESETRIKQRRLNTFNDTFEDIFMV